MILKSLANITFNVENCRTSTHVLSVSCISRSTDARVGTFVVDTIFYGQVTGVEQDVLALINV